MRRCGDTMADFEVIAYTDGACKGNPGIGGWGVLSLHVKMAVASSVEANIIPQIIAWN